MTVMTPEIKSPSEQIFKLVPPRGVIKTGMPTDGLWVIAGLWKSGKTSLAASNKDAIILELEKGGADRIEGWVQDIPDLVTFRQAFLAAVREPRAKTIIVDTLDVVLDWLETEVAEKYGLESMSERKEGVSGFATWAELAGKVAAMVGAFKNCGKLVVALAHFKEPRLSAEGKLVITNAINAPGKIGSYICSHADAIGVCSKDNVSGKTQYRLSFQGGGALGAFGSRIPELENKAIILPNRNQWAAVEVMFQPIIAAQSEQPTRPTETTTNKGRK